jgi:cytochrome c2
MLRKIKHILFFLLIVAIPGISQEPGVRYDRGERLFSTYCGPCHGIHREMLGPMLASITKKHEEEWLVKFIKNSQKVIVSGDEYANYLYEQYNQVVMPAFEYLSDEEIKDILFYIEAESFVRAGESIVDFPDFELNYEEEGEFLTGSKLFRSQCYHCHKVHEEKKGPALGSVTKRRPIPWLIKFIKNSREVIESGDEYAQRLDREYDEVDMISFNYLSDEDIMEILDYIDYESSSPPPIAGVNGKKLMSRKDYIPIPREIKIDKSTTKIIFIIISLFGATIHTFLIAKLFLYLYRKKKV